MRQESFRLTPEQERELQSLAEMPDEEIDFSDIPETLDWSGAQRGMFYRTSQTPRTPTNATNTATTTERGLESRIVGLLTNVSDDPSDPAASDLTTRERPAAYSTGWIAGDPADYGIVRLFCPEYLSKLHGGILPVTVAGSLSAGNF